MNPVSYLQVHNSIAFPDKPMKVLSLGLHSRQTGRFGGGLGGHPGLGLRGSVILGGRHRNKGGLCQGKQRPPIFSTNFRLL